MKRSEGPLRKKIRLRFSSNLRQAYFFSSLLLLAMGVYYVWTLNANANNGYKFRQIENERAFVEKEKNYLRTYLAKKESLDVLFSVDDDLVEISDEEILYFIVD